MNYSKEFILKWVGVLLLIACLSIPIYLIYEGVKPVASPLVAFADGGYCYSRGDYLYIQYETNDVLSQQQIRREAVSLRAVSENEVPRYRFFSLAEVQHMLYVPYESYEDKLSVMCPSR